MRVRATSGVGPASATREVWVRLADAFEFQARSTGPGVLVLEWRQRPQVSYLCPDSGHDLVYQAVSLQDDPGGLAVSHYPSHWRRFGPETTQVELTGLFPDHEYHVWMRERYASGCGFGNGAQDWVKSRVWTEGHGAALSVPRVSLTFPDPQNPDDFNAPVRGETTVVEGGPSKLRVLVDLPDEEYFEDGRTLDMNAGDPQLRHVDRAWASTVHAFQGRTVDRAIAAIEANHPNLTNQKMLYVEISRARDRAELVTDDKAGLKEQLEALTGERIAALEALGEEKAKGREAAPEPGKDVEKGMEMRERTTGREPEKAHEPKGTEREFTL